jgi:hypothetical protein
MEAMESPPRKTLSGKRYSASAEASRRAELERLQRMTALERMALALALGRRRRALLALRGEGQSK